ncbi:hypothetical protein L3Q82_006013 [Scortum barcoo]|uniref:Uncharacterized protein n=1 Tax=Scortum barcoo TaxID=214431 RepID=A0ACB8X2G0_9TELE|nr:hypothetical protein L3Q82_006013 [Scortum barcoo]
MVVLKHYGRQFTPECHMKASIGKMYKQMFFPGRVIVTLHTGLLGFLHKDTTNAAKLLKDNPVCTGEVCTCEGGAAQTKRSHCGPSERRGCFDRTELCGDDMLQFGKYKRKSLCWLLDNDIGFTIYLIQTQQKEEAAGVFMAEQHSNMTSAIIQAINCLHSSSSTTSCLRSGSQSAVCWQQQRIWMKTELEPAGLWSASIPVHNPTKTKASPSKAITSRLIPQLVQPSPKDQLTARLADRSHQCAFQASAAANNMALLCFYMRDLALQPDTCQPSRWPGSVGLPAPL